ncbi:hypothetical protein NPIL_269881, partial [Nephila pilipes]
KNVDKHFRSGINEYEREVVEKVRKKGNDNLERNERHSVPQSTLCDNLRDLTADK